MSKNTSNVTVKYTNDIISVDAPTTGIVFVVAKTQMGNLGDPSILISNKGQLALHYGDDTANYPALAAIQQILDEGGKVRVSRVLGVSPRHAELFVYEDFNNQNEELFMLKAKQPGIYGNQLLVTISSSGSNDFDLTIENTINGQIEKYLGIDMSSAIGEADITTFTFLRDVIEHSQLVDVTYFDLTSATHGPEAYKTNLYAGNDGGTVITGHMSIGCSAFDDYEDSFMITFPAMDESVLSGVDAIGVAYATGRADLCYIGNIPLDESDAVVDITDFLETMGSSRYTIMTGGGLKVVRNGSVVNISEKAAVVGHICKAQGANGVYRSPAGTQAGTLVTPRGVVHNYAPISKFSDLNTIANAGGNMVISKGGLIYLKDGYTMSKDSVDKFISVVMTDIYIRKLVVPIFEQGLNKPNTPTEWANTYYACKPHLDQLVQEDAILSYEYKGDQFATSTDDYEVNLPSNVAMGKYKVKLQIQTVSPMVEIEIEIIKTLENVSTN